MIVEKTIISDVPQDSIYMAFQMVDRMHPMYFAFDMLSDILSGSESSRFTNILVKEKEIFSHIHAYITGDIDKGLFVVEGKLNSGIVFDRAEASILEILNEISVNGLDHEELTKVKNKSLTSNLFAKTSVLNKAMALCYSYRLGDVELVNTDIERIKSLQNSDIQNICKEYLLNNTQAVLKYKTK